MLETMHPTDSKLCTLSVDIHGSWTFLQQATTDKTFLLALSVPMEIMFPVN